MRSFETNHSELVLRDHEDVGIDDQHDQQRHQHTAKEVEKDHVVHGDHSFEQTLAQAIWAGAACVVGGSGVQTCATETGEIFCLIIATVNKHGLGFRPQVQLCTCVLLSNHLCCELERLTLVGKCRLHFCTRALFSSNSILLMHLCRSVYFMLFSLILCVCSF